MIELLLFIGIIVAAIAIGNHSTTKEQTTAVANPEVDDNNQKWMLFIASFRKRAKTKVEKDFLEQMLKEAKAQGFNLPQSQETELLYPGEHTVAAQTAALKTADEPANFIQIDDTSSRQKTELDNASLLLYFGAFLFVASVGLFIAFGGANGVIRTLAVLVVMFTMYGAGIWLFQNKPKLQQAGLAFGGIGMTIAPLSGVAAYNYLFSQNNAPVLWGLTSLLCLVMYAHALMVFRRPLISYVLIFTFVSLFESSVSIIHAPVYYFGWMMAFIGILLAVVSRLKGFWPEMQESSTTSSQLFLPLAILASAVVVPTYGAGQLGVSLLFATLFYGLEMLNTQGTMKQNNASVAQLSAIAAIVSLSYAYNQSWKTVAISLLVTNIIQTFLVIWLPAEDTLARNFATILLATTVGGTILGVISPGILTASLACMIIIGLIVWRRQKRLDSYALSVFAWMSLPLIIGQVLLAPRLEPSLQAGLMLAVLLVQLTVYAWFRSKETVSWNSAAQRLYLFSAVAVLFASFFTVPLICMAISLVVAATMAGLAEYEKDHDWSTAAGLAVCVPVLHALGKTSGVYDLSIVAALLINIAFALRYRQEANRWISTILWLLVPIALGGGVIVREWNSLAYAWAYVVVTLCLVFSRAIARGNVFLSKHVPLASLARSASSSYVAGYSLTGIAAVILAFSAANAELHATAVLAVMAVLVFVLGRSIEKDPNIMGLLPPLLQAILWSGLRPTIGTDSTIIFLVSSTFLAAVCYLVWDLADASKNRIALEAIQVKHTALLSAFITPVSIFFVGELSWTMPLGLFVAGCLAYYHWRTTTQANREVAAGIVVASVLWFLYYLGIRELQAYTHLIAAVFAGYAYWRVTRGEDNQADQYLMCMLLSATVPLALQALNGLAGGLYGWWLLLEQIGFMLLGMAIRKPAVTKWGLYVALGAVLYQLRNLGWAALTILALFLIGMAIYRLQKHSDKN